VDVHEHRVSKMCKCARLCVLVCLCGVGKGERESHNCIREVQALFLTLRGARKYLLYFY